VLHSKASPADRLIALKFLGHWVGDIHQPLHVSFEDDRGGNDITATGQCSGVLHGTWDTCLVFKVVGEDVAEAATDLIDSMTPAMKERWTDSKSRDWANESLAIAEAAKTKYRVIHGGSCDKPAQAASRLTPLMWKRQAIIREQLLKAGVRLS
jgi:hypothetical protein